MVWHRFGHLLTLHPFDTIHYNILIKSIYILYSPNGNIAAQNGGCKVNHILNGTYATFGLTHAGCPLALP